MSDVQSKVARLADCFAYKNLDKYVGLFGSRVCRAPTTYVGVEIELEKVKWISPTLPSSLRTHEDGSLKLDGQEIVTVPIQFGYLEQELLRLTSALKDPLISARCSVHVHLNVRDFIPEELHKFLILYMLFEKALFRFSGNRYKSNFCVPVSSYPPMVVDMLIKTQRNMVDQLQWTKYSALNLCPIWGGETRQVLGTVEFRHMEGTLNIDRIINWINLIVSLKIAAKQLPIERLYELVRTMNTTSDYYWLSDYVFMGWSKLIIDQPTFKEDVESCILSTKKMMFDAGLLNSDKANEVLSLNRKVGV